ncbi:LPXTG cell wall anchor domain-containing protein [Streptomyces sp. HUAS CX7]|uniref:LPXTG cell wall anchor domain-containing protein n=1 Tax=Streptomyces sp. HUAS CX7 TaxID=3062782 RepID=UPI0026E9B0F3|nr:LPXTG cell wall anchor domain-containing protein [Streptomyces sp. HUAS CX7]WKX19856.1 LPXTG cell wall anchor domain-containing protein [Streptomyces sp. HUAS CX7]
MRRTILSAVALACTAVLAGTAPAFADGPSPVPSAPAESAPSPTAEPTEATPVPSVSVPAEEPTRAAAPAPADGQVSVVPEGAADTGVAGPADTSGTDQGLVGAGAGGVLLAGGAVLFVVRRRRAAATGA